MNLYCKIILEIVFFILFFGWYIPYCFNQSSDFWFFLGLMSVLVFIPIEVWRFINFIFDYFKK